MCPGEAGSSGKTTLANGSAVSNTVIDEYRKPSRYRNAASTIINADNTIRDQAYDNQLTSGTARQDGFETTLDIANRD